MSFMTICNLKHIMSNVACPRDLLWVLCCLSYYMNGICNVSKFLYTILYADDTCVLLNGKDHKIIRIITFSHNISHTQPLFQDLSVLPLEKLVLYRIALIMYKISNSLIPKTMSDLYITNKDIHSHDTRYKNLFIIPKGTINYTSLSARLWNILNMKIDVHVPLSQFK